MIRYTPYAEDRLRGRKLSRDLVERTIEAPGQLLEAEGRKLAQSRYTDSGKGKEYLVRVIYELLGNDMLVITAYQTSKVGKYWEGQ